MRRDQGARSEKRPRRPVSQVANPGSLRDPLVAGRIGVVMIDATIVPVNLTEIGKIEGTTAVKIVNETDIEKDIETETERKTKRGIGNEFTIATVGGMTRIEIDEEIALASRAGGRGRISPMLCIAGAYLDCMLHYDESNG